MRREVYRIIHWILIDVIYRWWCRGQLIWCGVRHREVWVLRRVQQPGGSTACWVELYCMRCQWVVEGLGVIDAGEVTYVIPRWYDPPQEGR